MKLSNFLKYLFQVAIFSCIILIASVNVVSAQANNPQLSCKVHEFLVDNEYNLPFKYDSPELVNGSSTINTGNSFIYVFEVFNKTDSERLTLNKIATTQLMGSNEPIEIMQTNPINGSCTINKFEKSIACDINYSFAQSATYPIEYLYKITNNPNNYPKASSMFTVETNVGTTQCAGTLWIKNSGQRISPNPVTPHPIGSPSPVPDDKFMKLQDEVDKLSNELVKQQSIIQKIQLSVNQITEFLKNIFKSIFK